MGKKTTRAKAPFDGLRTLSVVEAQRTSSAERVEEKFSLRA